MTSTEKITLALLRDALGFGCEKAGGPPHEMSHNPLHDLLRGMDGAQWRAVYRFTVEHFVTAIVFARVSQLPKELMPPRNVLIEWMVHADKVAADNRRFTAATLDLVALAAQRGIRSLIIKGVGVAACYPDPALREQSDVDIYFYDRYADVNEMVRGMGIELDGKFSDKECGFIYKGVIVENHRTFLDADRGRAELRYERTLCGLLDTGGVRRVAAGGRSAGEGSGEDRAGQGGGGVEVPNLDFCALHVARHAGSHFAGGEITMRHLCDIAALLHAGAEMGLLRRNAGEGGFRRFVDAMAGLCIDHLGLDPALAAGIVRDNKLENRILADIFSRNGRRDYDLGQRGRAVRMRFKLSRFCAGIWKYRLIYDEGPLVHVARAVALWLRKPAVIFKT